jgi:excisionase family DNA binding protein
MTSNLSLRAAAGRLGVAPLTLRRWAVYQRRIPFLRLGRRLLFRQRDLEAFEQANLVAAARGDNVRGR